MRRRTILGGFAALIVPLSRAALAQSGSKRPLIAWLNSTSINPGGNLDGFLPALREQGYVEGRDFDIVIRSADGHVERLPALAEEMIRLKPDVVVAAGVTAATPVKAAAPKLPIVCTALVDPVGLGWAESEARPGGSVTGILLFLDGMSAKQLDLAVKAVPGTTKVGFLFNPRTSVAPAERREIERAAPGFGVEIVVAEVRTVGDLDRAFDTLAQRRVNAVLVPRDPIFLTEIQRIVTLAATAHLPAIYSTRLFVVAGGFISYGVNLRASGHRAAAYVVKILKGVKPGDLPIEFPTKLELVINLKTAKTLGLTIPAALLAVADEVIE